MSSEWIITGILVALPAAAASIKIIRDLRAERRRREIRQKTKGDGMP